MKKLVLNLTALVFLLIAYNTYAQTEETVFFEDFESGWGSWWADNGIWEIGMPTVGPDNAYSGQECAGTVLGGNYLNNANTRLISPQITLPCILSGEELRLRFWHWFLMDNNPNDYDYGVVQVSMDNGSSWETISGNYDEYSSVWTQVSLPLSDYANSTIRIAFYFRSSDSEVANGWYIDDVAVVKGSVTFNNPEDFELGMGDWSVDNGLWEIGAPTVGPVSCHSGQSCAGTVLSGNYHNSANTRLISPEIALTPSSGQNIGLYFWHWYRMDNNPNDYDYGVVQISVDNGNSWENISGNYDEYSTVWTQAFVPLTAYENSTVRLAFYFTSSDSETDNGWYIDDIRIEGITGVDINENSIENANIYPNPFANKTTIKFHNPNHSNYKLSVFNITGHKVFEMDNITTDKVEFERGNLAKGVYIVELRGEEVFRRKIIIE